MRKAFLNCFLLSICFVLLPGCISDNARKQITDFSTATETVSAGAKTVFEDVEKVHRENKLETYFKNFQGKFEAPTDNPPDFEPFLSDKTFQLRQDVIEGVAAYSKKLAILVSKDPLEKLDEESLTLGSALSKLQENEVVVAHFPRGSDVKVSVVVAALNTLGRWIIEFKQEKEAKAAIAQMSTQVKLICKVLKDDIGKWPEADRTGGTGLSDQVALDYYEVADARKAWIKKHVDHLSPESLRTHAQFLVDLREREATAKKLFDSIKTSVDKLATAHDQLATAFDNNQTTLQGLIADLSAEAKHIREIYKKLNDKKKD